MSCRVCVMQWSLLSHMEGPLFFFCSIVHLSLSLFSSLCFPLDSWRGPFALQLNSTCLMCTCMGLKVQTTPTRPVHWHLLCRRPVRGDASSVSQTKPKHSETGEISVPFYYGSCSFLRPVQNCCMSHLTILMVKSGVCGFLTFLITGFVVEYVR